MTSVAVCVFTEIEDAAADIGGGAFNGTNSAFLCVASAVVAFAGNLLSVGGALLGHWRDFVSDATCTNSSSNGCDIND